jgi:hypothetical protein
VCDAPATEPTEPGPSSIRNDIQIHPMQPAGEPGSAVATSSSTAHITHNSYVWNTQTECWSPYSFPVQQSSHSGATFPSSNSTHTYPTFASTIFPFNQITESLHENCSCSSNLVPPSPRSESPTSSHGSDGDDSSSPRKSSKRIRISRRNPIHGFVEGVMAGNSEHSKSINEKSFIFLSSEPRSSQKAAAGPAN